MGDERDCRFESRDRVGEGRALFEAHEIVFRGPFRARIPLDSVRDVTAQGGVLTLTYGTETVRLVFPNDAACAQKWAAKLAHPKARLDKLGVKAEHTVHLVGLEHPDDPAFFAELDARGCEVAERAATADFVFVHARTLGGLHPLAALRSTMKATAALWLLRAKGKTSLVGETDARAAARGAGFVDVKVVAFSEALTAAKYVVPIAER